MLLGFIPVFFILLFSVKQQTIRKEMKEKMEKEQLHTIVIADNEIQWAKAGKEIWVEGKMFDIKSSKSEDGFTTFKGLFDHEETLLKLVLKKNWGKSQANHNQLFAQLFQTLQSIYFTYPDNSFTESSNLLQVYPFFSPNIQTQFLEIPTPPPLI